MVNVGKYSSPMEHLGIIIRSADGDSKILKKNLRRPVNKEI